MKRHDMVRKALAGEFAGNGRSQMLACALEIKKLRKCLENLVDNRPISNFKPWVLSVRNAQKVLDAAETQKQKGSK